MDSLDAIFLKGLNRDHRPPFFFGFTGEDRVHISGFTYDNDRFFKNAGSGTEEVNALSQFSVLSGIDDNTRLNDAFSNQSAISLSVTTASNLLLSKNAGERDTKFTEAETCRTHTKDGILIYENSMRHKADGISFDSHLFNDASPAATDDRRDLFSGFSRDVLSNDEAMPHPDKLDCYFIPPQTGNLDFGIGPKKDRGF